MLAAPATAPKTDLESALPSLPLRDFLEQVQWVSLEELGQQENLDAAVDLLTLPVRAEPELGPRCRRILAKRQDLEPVVFSMLFERFPKLSREEILMIGGLPLQELRHSRAVQEILEEGRLEGRQEGREEGLEAGPSAGSRRSGRPASHTAPRHPRRW